ncbi:VOC family protein [Sphingomonas cavernae]|uniref:VOC family protein n=1 Tax=Sphingomonas cavernae TaxID=2320861 RepID=A0A418WRV5_9SPHN|nr:VOC family protein [Sphingomonas cavernae]RJF93965.1 VOC family protein [Sphingomonas cavernae]
MIRKVAFTMYPVSNMPRARAFYEGALGLSSGWPETSPWVEYDLPEGGCLAITTVTAEAPSASAGGTIAFEVADLDALVAGLKSREVTLVGDLVKGPHCRMMVCLDPDGNSIVLHQLDPKQ